MRLVDVDRGWAEAFKGYARLHGSEHDDSYTVSDELESFDPVAEPAALALGDDGRVVGAASLMVDRFVTAGNARFRILHAASRGVYPALLSRLLERVPADVGRVFLFLPPDASSALYDALRAAGFCVSRRAYVLSAPVQAAGPEAALPRGVEAHAAGPGRGREWAHVLNAAFVGEPGRYDMTPEQAGRLLSRSRVVPRGTMLAFEGERAIGAVMSVCDDDDVTAAEIETLCVVPDRQGRGVGKGLLTAALSALRVAGFGTVLLSVSASNESALRLYLDSGFRVVEERVCWELTLPHAG